MSTPKQQPIATSSNATTTLIERNHHRVSTNPVVRAMISNNRMSNCQDVSRMLKECSASKRNDRVCQVAMQYADMCILDNVTVEYGFEARPILSLASSLSSRRLGSKQEYPSSVVGRRNNHADATTRRRLQEEDEEKDPFFVFGGTIKGTMNDNFFSASWDLSFYVLMETAANKESEIYVLDKEDGKPKTFPCIYFAEGSNITTAQVQAMLSEEDAIAAGGQDGHVAFGSGSFQLYANETTTVPASAGGQFVPKVYVSGSLKDTEVSAILGGLDGTGIFDWTPTSKFKSGIGCSQGYPIPRRSDDAHGRYLCGK